MKFELEIILAGGDKGAMSVSMAEQGFTETDTPLWADTRSNGDLVWKFYLQADEFPE